MNPHRIHNQEQTIMGNLSAYSSVGSSPKAPLDPGTAAFVKGKPSQAEAARDWRYYEGTILQMHKLEGAVLREYKDGGTLARALQNMASRLRAIRQVPPSDRSANPRGYVH